MIRHSIIDIKYLKELKDKNPRIKNESMELNGASIKRSSQRYKVFQDNPVCVSCGVEGTILAIEKQMAPCLHYHINLYGINDKGEEVLMTKDHIIPKSKEFKFNPVFSWHQ